MNTASLTPGLLVAAALGLMTGASTGAWAQDALSIANNDSVYIDATTFKVAPGKAKGDLAAQINKLGARELGAGAIIFRASDKLYIMEPGASPKLVTYDPARPDAYDPGDARRFAVDPARPYAYDPGDARRFMYDQHSDPRRFAYDTNDWRCAGAYQNDPRCPLINNPNGAVYVNDPDYAQYRLKKVFDENWTAASAKQ
jgi:hypothetical protein